MTDNTVINTKTAGSMTSGVCIHGPLVGKRVVRNGTDPWIPAGDATREEMMQSKDDQYGDVWSQVFGQRGGR